MKLEKTEKADQDLVDIYVYGATNYGEKHAEEYFSSLENIFSLIQDNPKMGWKRQEFVPTVRSHQHREHVIIYTTENNTILIVRVLGKSMDITKHISN